MVQNWNNMDLMFEIVLLLVKHKRMHLREIARILKQSHATIHRTIKEMLRKNIIDFKMEGKNKVFALKKCIETINFAYMAEYYRTAKTIEKYSYLSPIVEDILKSSKDKIIVLFGSHAKFNAKKDSDIDIYIETNNRKTKKDIERMNSKLSVKIGSFDTDNFLIKEIIKNHTILRGVEEFYEKAKIFN